jgi:hypothetical protein
LVGKPEGKRHLEYLGVDWKIMLEWLLGKSVEKVKIGCIWLRMEKSDGS